MDSQLSNQFQELVQISFPSSKLLVSLDFMEALQSKQKITTCRAFSMPFAHRNGRLGPTGDHLAGATGPQPAAGMPLGSRARVAATWSPWAPAAPGGLNALGHGQAPRVFPSHVPRWAPLWDRSWASAQRPAHGRSLGQVKTSLIDLTDAHPT